MTRIIQIRKPHPKGQLKRLWQNREAVQALVGRQFKSRFEKPMVGLSWMLLQPIILAGLFAIFFGALVRVPSGNLPYPAFVFVGIALWQGVQRALSESANVFESAAPMLRQTSLPRLAPVLANVIGASIDVMLALIVAVFAGLLFGTTIGLSLFLAPVFLLLALIATIGLAAALGGLCGAWRDLRQTIALGLQILMFASPVIYPSSLIPEQYRVLYALNPYAGVIEGLRFTLLGGPMPDPLYLLISASSAFAVFIIGIWLFLSLEGRAADAL